MRGLYIVATPIGNLGDWTDRARAVVGGADLVACEDTRVTARLLARFGLTARLQPYHEHNAASVRPRLMARLADGAAVALVSDAGTPLISDPGYRLVAACHEAGIPVLSVPGPSAAIAALSIAGLPTDRFLFAGFLPPKAGARRRAIAELSAVPATLVLYEAPHRVATLLADLAAALGPRPAALAREITKRHEEVRRGALDVLAAALAAEPPPRGELVVLVGPPERASAEVDDATLDARLAEALATLSVREAATRVAAETGLPRRAVYQRALALSERT